MRKFALTMLAVLGGLCGSISAGARTPAKPVSCQTISRDQVAEQFNKWNAALATKKTEAVLATYAAEATLLPTVQEGPLVGRELIGKYFDYFLKQSPSAVIGTRVIKTGCNIAYDIGLYRFTVDGDQPGQHKLVKARFTFIYAPERGKWLIVHHHSSAVPAPPS